MAVSTDPAARQVPVCARAELSPGEVRVVPGAEPIAVFCADDGEVYALADSCTHQRTPLSDGWVEGTHVECPLHESCFDLRTGEPLGPPATVPVRTYPVVEVDGIVHVVLG